MIQVLVPKNGADMEAAVKVHKPDVIVCPFLTKRVPDTVWKNVTTLIAHPGPLGDRGVSSLDWAIHYGEKVWGVTVVEAADEWDAGPVWATRNFSVPSGLTKSTIYRNLVVPAAVDAVMEAINKVREYVHHHRNSCM